jgi:hypothetical protein
MTRASELPWLGELTALVRAGRPDLLLVSSEGRRLPTWRLLLGLHSPLLAGLLRAAAPGTAAVSLPAPAATITALLAALGAGARPADSALARLLGLAGPPQAPGTKHTKHKYKPRDDLVSVLKSKNIISSENIDVHIDYEDFDEDTIVKEEIADENFEEGFDDFSDDYIHNKSGGDLNDTIKASNYVRDREEERNPKNEMDNLEDGVSDDDSNEEEEWKPNVDTKSTLPKNNPVLVTINPGELQKGLTFPDYDSMVASVHDWSEANFSPIVTKSSCRSRGKRLVMMACPHANKRKSKSTGKRIRKGLIEHVACPVMLTMMERPDGSYVVTRATTEHEGHEVSEEMFKKYRRTRRLTAEQEEAVMLLLTQGAKVADIGRMLTDFTGRHYDRRDAYNLIAKLKKERMKIDSETGERMVEFQGRSVAVSGLAPGLPGSGLLPGSRPVSFSAAQEAAAGEAARGGAATGEVAALLSGLTGRRCTHREAVAAVKAAGQGPSLEPG